MKALPFGFGLIIAALVSLIIVGVAIVRSDLAALQETSKENVFWSAAQVEREFNALQVALAQHAMEPVDEGANVRRRFDILWSRLELFRTGDVGARLVSQDSVRLTVEGLQDTMRKLDPSVQALGNDSNQTRALIAELAHSAGAIRRTTVEILHADEARFADVRENMRSGLLMTAGAVFLSLLLAIGTAVTFHRHAKRSAMLAQTAREASESKARFFSMMSHELRTPLNGLLGALNLLRDMPAGTNRFQLLNEASGSAHRLSDVLTDALTLGAEEGVASEIAVFSALDIVSVQEKSLATELARRGASLEIESGNATGYARGEVTRLNNATSHLLSSVLQRGGATRLKLTIRIDDSQVFLTVSSDTETPPEAFGETLARGLLEFSGGTLERTDSGWHLSMPVERITPSARLALSSTSMKGLYEKLLKSRGVKISNADEGDFHIVLADPVLDETAQQMLREQFPRSRIIACGATGAATGFDAVMSGPNDLNRAVASALSNPPLAA